MQRGSHPLSEPFYRIRAVTLINSGRQTPGRLTLMPYLHDLYVESLRRDSPRFPPHHPDILDVQHKKKRPIRRKKD
jgi:hypothetical protein